MALKARFAATHVTLESADAIRSLTKVFQQKHQFLKNHDEMSKAQAIYECVKGTKNASIMNVMLKVCLHLKQPEKIQLIWPDILQHHDKDHNPTKHDDAARLSYPLLLSCCVQSDRQNLEYPIQVLEWMKSTNYKVHKKEQKDFSHNITSLISHCVDPSFISPLQQIHKSLPPTLIPKDIYISTALMNAYSKCGPSDDSITNILSIFHSIDSKVQSAHSIATMMRIFMDYERYNECLSLYHQYSHLHDAMLHSFALKSCIKLNDHDTGNQIISIIHQHTVSSKESKINLKNVMIEFYGHFGDIRNAKYTFDSMSHNEKDCITLSNMMSALVASSQRQEAVNIFQEHRSLHDKVSIMLAIKTCAEIGDFDVGNRIISEAPVHIWNINQFQNCLIDFHGRSGDIESAQQIFRNQKINDVVRFNTMMTALVNNGHHKSALSLYHEYSDSSNTIDDVSHLLALKGCMNLKDITGGKTVCERAMKKETTDRIIELNNAMIDFYGTFCHIESAERIFDGMKSDSKQKDSISLNTMMKVYIHRNLADKALNIYNEYGSLQNDASHVLSIKACTHSGNVNEGKRIHGTLEWKNRMNLEVMNTLIHFYGHFGDINAAKKIFKSIGDGIDRNRDVVTFGALLEVYCGNEMHDECIELFESMERNYGVRPDVICISIVLEVCGRAGFLEIGQRLHLRMKEGVDWKWILSETHIQCKLINMYGKSGMVKECEEIFNGVEDGERSIDLWNVMMNVYAKNGALQTVKELLERMESDVMTPNPDVKTYGVLIHCLSHSGQAEEAFRIWEEIQEDTVKFDAHIVTSLIDGMARKGILSEAFEIVMKYDFEHWPMYMALLSGCRTHNDKELGVKVYKQIQRRFEDDDHVISSALTLLKQIQNQS